MSSTNLEALISRQKCIDCFKRALTVGDSGTVVTFSVLEYSPFKWGRMVSSYIRELFSTICIWSMALYWTLNKLERTTSFAEPCSQLFGNTCGQVALQWLSLPQTKQLPGLLPILIVSDIQLPIDDVWFFVIVAASCGRLENARFI